MKRVFVFIFVFMLMIWPSFSAYASLTGKTTISINSIDYIQIKAPNVFKKGSVSISGEYPFFDPAAGRVSDLNSGVSKIIDVLEKSAIASKASSLEYHFETKRGGMNEGEDHIVSVIIYSTTTTASSLDKINTLVYNEKNMKILQLEDIIGNNGRKLASGVVIEEIRQNPGVYLNNFTALSENQSFYVDEGKVILAFDKYEIAPGTAGTQLIEMDIAKVLNVTFEPSDYKYSQNSAYEVRMIPLRNICEAFGFKVNWTGSTQNITITRGNRTVPLKIDENKYKSFIGTGDLSHTLEAAPEIIDGATYVPVSFAEAVLGLNYSVDSTGVITVSEYLR